MPDLPISGSRVKARDDRSGRSINMSEALCQNIHFSNKPCGLVIEGDHFERIFALIRGGHDK